MAEQKAWLESQQIHVSDRIAQEVFPKVNPQIFADVLRRNTALINWWFVAFVFEILLWLLSWISYLLIAPIALIENQVIKSALIRGFQGIETY